MIRRLSPKRAKQYAAYSKIRVEYLSNNPYCHVENINTGIPCGKVANQIHHKRGRIGDLLTDQRFFLAVCPKCHETIENNPKWAKKMGYSLERFNR